MQIVSVALVADTWERFTAPLIMAANLDSNREEREQRPLGAALRSRPNVRLLRAGGAAVLSGTEQQSRVPEAAGDERVEPGGGQHADVGQLWIRGPAEVPSSLEPSTIGIRTLLILKSVSKQERSSVELSSALVANGCSPNPLPSWPEKHWTNQHVRGC